MFQAASKVSSMVGLMDVELVAGEVVVLPGYQGEQDHMLVYAAWNRLAEVQMTTRSVWLLYMRDADHGVVRYIQAPELIQIIACNCIATGKTCSTKSAVVIVREFHAKFKVVVTFSHNI